MDERSNVLPFPQAPEAVELRHLRAFVAVAEELNFSRAAERLFVSQPSLSRQIKALERLLACELVDRSTHHVELTLAGEALLDRARSVLRDIDEAVAATQAIGGELVGRVVRLWEPTVEAVTNQDLDARRAAYEALHAEQPVPPDVLVRPVNTGGVASLLLSPMAEAASTLLYLHGGAYVLGSAFGYRHLAAALALEASANALVPDYRLAPEHPFPAAIDDVVSAYRWLLDRGTQPEHIVVGADSTGSGLALALLLRARDEGLPLPAASALMCPVVDLTGEVHNPSVEPAASTAAAEALRREFTDPYLAGHPLDDPLVSPLRADLTGLSPLLVQAATGDAQRTQGHLLAEHAQRCGVDVQLELYPTATHGFQLFWSFLPEAADAVRRAGGFLTATTRARVAETGS